MATSLIGQTTVTSSDDVTVTNDSTGVNDAIHNFCSSEIPTAQEFLRYLPAGGYVILVLLFICVLATIVIYVEQVVFILRTFKITVRKEKTTWILAAFPVYSVSSFLAVLVPRSGTLVDLVANSFFASCLFKFGQLMVNYMGGEQRMWQIVGPNRPVAMNTPPCCCCCVCLPQQRLSRSFFFRVSMQVMQVSVVRPVIMFLAAVLWTNGSYQAGNMSLGNGFIYVTVVNIASTMLAVYGLMLLRGALRPELEKDFVITGKILSLQMTLVASAVPNFIIGILIATDVIKCGAYFPSKGRGEEIYHGILVMLMLPFALMARKFFRRVSDGCNYAQEAPLANELTAASLPLNSPHPAQAAAESDDKVKDIV